MINLETPAIDKAHETIHDQIRKLADTLMETSGIKLERVTVDWCDFVGVKSQICNIDILTSKR